jgi:hypothetical protein
MRRRVHAERKPRDDRKPGIAQSASERLGIAGALSSRVAASYHGECRLAQQLEASDGVEERRRVADLEQRFRICRMIERDKRVAWALRPIECACYALRDFLRVQAIEYVGSEGIREGAAACGDHRLRQAEAAQQFSQRSRAEAGRQRQLKPAGQPLGRCRRVAGACDQGVRTKSRGITGRDADMTSAYETRSNTRNTNVRP